MGLRFETRVSDSPWVDTVWTAVRQIERARGAIALGLDQPTTS
ncbi:hypothetical protein ACFQ1L_25975 [Phytohabitans flavus]|nr:hypothetical protein [Phytohabitans flavus]